MPFVLCVMNKKMRILIKILCLGISLSYSVSSLGQNSLSNGSFEKWIKDKPSDLIIVTDSPDFYKRRTRIYPEPFWDDSIPTYFPKRGADGVSYIGLHSTVATVESVGLVLDQQLVKNNNYYISCSAKRLNLESYRYFDSLAYSVTDTIPFVLDSINRDLKGFSSVNSNQFSSKINITGYMSFSETRNDWKTMEGNFIANGTEKYLIVFPPLPSSPDSIYYVMYDNFKISIAKDLELSLYFETNESKLSSRQFSELDLWIKQLPIDNIDSLVIKGYTDNVGEGDYNLNLSEMRAKSISYHIDTTYGKLKTIHYGLGENISKTTNRAKRKVIIKAHAKTNNEEKATIDTSIFRILEQAYFDDQQFRTPNQTDSTNEHKIENIDRRNKEILVELFDEHGYIGVTKLNSEMKDYMAIMTLHQDVEFQLKYLPIIEEAADYRECSPALFAYLLDKIKVSQKEKQIFGTQLFYSEKEHLFKPFPISNESNVNKRRKEYGLGRIQDYIESFNIDSEK